VDERRSTFGLAGSKEIEEQRREDDDGGRCRVMVLIMLAVEGRRGEAVIFGRFQVIVGGVGVGEDWRLVWL